MIDNNKAMKDFINRWSATVEIEISERPEALPEIIREAEKFGLRFNRTEARYLSCIIAVFEYAP